MLLVRFVERFVDHLTVCRALREVRRRSYRLACSAQVSPAVQDLIVWPGGLAVLRVRFVEDLIVWPRSARNPQRTSSSSAFLALRAPVH